MSGLKPVGSEKLPLQEKIDRIKQIAGIVKTIDTPTSYSILIIVLEDKMVMFML